jgi:hypothetical protein
MGYLYGRFIGYCIRLVVVATLVLIKAMRWLKDYRKIQTDYDNSLNAQLEGLKYKNTQNKKKGNKNDNQS